MNIKKRKIFYWSPSLVDIATNMSVINSAYSLNKYSNKYCTYIINFFGEFNRFNKKLRDKKLTFLNYYHENLYKKFPSEGKIKSRFSFILIFLMSFFPLKRLLKKEVPDYLIIHLITSLPLVLLVFFKFKTKFILRISGYPRMNFFRKILWRLALRKIYLVTCPTQNTFKYLISLNLVDKSKIKILYDPIINLKEINKKKRESIKIKNYFLSVGRLTKQKNFIFLCKAFKEIIKEYSDIKLLIAGNGEQENKIKKFIEENNLTKSIFLLGYIENIYPYFKNSNGFILTSLWEDPGFVLIEAAFCRTPILSCNAWPGPVELIKNNFNGITFKNNDMESFLREFKKFYNYKNKNFLLLNNLKASKKFSLFSHYKSLVNLL